VATERDGLRVGHHARLAADEDAKISGQCSMMITVPDAGVIEPPGRNSWIEKDKDVDGQQQLSQFGR
jgi:hypothetical protein